VVKEIGLLGLVVVTLIFIFITYATQEQKETFIDKYILLKGSPGYCAVIIVFLMAVIIIGGLFQQKIINAKTRENNRIGERKSELQAQSLSKDLRSSKKEE
jgi:hypothetical protein